MTPNQINAPGALEQALTHINTLRVIISVLVVFLVAVGLHDWWGRMHATEIVHLTVLNPDGRVLWTQQAGSYTKDELNIEGIVQDWIERIRWRGDDPVLDARNRAKAELMADQQCYQDLQRSKRAKDLAEEKLNSALKNRLRVKVEDFVREKQPTKNMYKLWWTEKVRPLYGNEIQDIKMSGVFTVEVRTSYGLFGPYLNVGDVNKSPTGVFLVGCVFSRIEESSL